MFYYQVGNYYLKNFDLRVMQELYEEKQMLKKGPLFEIESKFKNWLVVQTKNQLENN